MIINAIVTNGITALNDSPTDMSAVDYWRQGVELTQDKHFYQGMIAKIWSGEKNHQLKQQSFGELQDQLFPEQTNFQEVSVYSPVSFISRPQPTIERIIVGSVPQYDTNVYDGIIEPLAVRRAPQFSSAGTPVEAHAFCGNLESGNFNKFSNADNVSQKTQINQEHLGESAFKDRTDISTGSLVPVYTRKVSPFSDVQLLNGMQIPPTASNVLINALQNMSPATDGYVPNGYRVSSAGFTFQNTYGLGADSIAYGNLTFKKLTHLAPPGINLFFYGNSYTAGFLASDQATTDLKSFTGLVGTFFASTCISNHLGRSGYPTRDLVFLSHTDVDPFFQPNQTNVVIVQEVSNDVFVVGTSVQQGQDHIRDLCNNLRSSGWRVLVATPSKFAAMTAGMKTITDTIATWIRANYTQFADGIVDWNNNILIANPDVHPENFGDGTHWNDLGMAIAATMIEAVLPSIISLGPAPVNQPPVISSLWPSFGPSSGGAPLVITITGRNFRTGATVKVGGVSALGVSVPAATSITFQLPAGSAGTLQDVVVTNTDASTTTLSSGFAYVTGDVIQLHASQVVNDNSMLVNGSLPGAVWTDRSGGTHNFTSFGPSPTVDLYGINGYPALTSDGTTQYLTCSTFGSPASGHVWIISKRVTDPAVINGSGLWNAGSSGVGSFVPHTDDIIYEDFGSLTRRTGSAVHVNLAAPFLYEVQSTAGAWSNYLNAGAAYSSDAVNTVSWPGVFHLFHSSTGQFYPGWVADMLLCSSIQGATIRNFINSALKTRYAIP